MVVLEMVTVPALAFTPNSVLWMVVPTSVRDGVPFAVALEQEGIARRYIAPCRC